MKMEKNERTQPFNVCEQQSQVLLQWSETSMSGRVQGIPYPVPCSMVMCDFLLHTCDFLLQEVLLSIIQ